ncbi:MAG: GspH/FimT family pseudopilin [Rhodobacteraceae bacterium]|jgi:prepilin-type N-terminal cleavage/methylation domain-containing protein|nr:GspH/FimT family pseudopilin [Paracoccaceae bacterium]
MDAELRRQAGQGDRGFTLVELVVVVAVLAVLAVSVTLTGGFARAGSSADRAAGDFARAVAAARDRALALRGLQGLAPLADGWQMMAPDGDGGWLARGVPGQAPGAVWTVAGAPFLPAPGQQPAIPAILFLPDGRGTAFSLVLPDRAGPLACRTDGWEAPRCARD